MPSISKRASVLLTKSAPPGSGLRTLFHELFRGSWRLGLLSLLPGPGPWVAELRLSAGRDCCEGPCRFLPLRRPF